MSTSRSRRVLSFAVIAVTAGAATAIGSRPIPSTTPTVAAPATTRPGIEAALAAREVRAAARLGLAEVRLRAMSAPGVDGDDSGSPRRRNLPIGDRTGFPR
jgi:hypothetical protein